MEVGYSMKKKLCFVISLCSLMIFLQHSASFVQAAEKDTLVDSNLNYIESTEYDLGYYDCGYSGADWIVASPGKKWTVNPSGGLRLLLIGIGGYSSGMNGTGVDYDLDEAFFTSLEETLQNARRNGATVGIRLRYDDNGTQNPEPKTFEKVLYHVKQLGESGLFDTYEDVITYIESGTVGAWGEQWGGKYTSLECKAELLHTYLEITPDSIPILVRTPNTVRTWLKMYCNIETTSAFMSCEILDLKLKKKFSRIGLYNDGYMGSDSDLGTYENRVGETAWLSGAPMYGGEYSGADEWRMKFKTWQPEYCLREMYDTHISHINCNIYQNRLAVETYGTYEEASRRLEEIVTLYQTCGMGDFDLKGSITEKNGIYKVSWIWAGYDSFIFDEKLDKTCGVSCDNRAFYGKTVWQFIRAHLGYRYVLRSSKLTTELGPGDLLKLQFEVENTGFASTPKKKEVEVILSNGNTNYSYTTNLDATNWLSASRVKEQIQINLPKTITGGNWNVYLRISKPNDETQYDSMNCIKFANEELQYSEELGANLLGVIHVSGEKLEQRIKSPNMRPTGYYKKDAEAMTLNEIEKISFIDTPYTLKEDHYGITFLYKIDGMAEKSEIQLGNWYLLFRTDEDGYSSAYTTYGLNTFNLTLTENGCYLLHIPFFSAVFNFPGLAKGGKTRINELNINDSRNYWSANTFTKLGENLNVNMTSLAVIEGAPSGYYVTVHFREGDKVYQGDYGLTDVSKQNITNLKAETVLSLIKEKYEQSYMDESGFTYQFVGFTTKEGDVDELIDEDFIAIGEIELFPYYELDKTKTNFNQCSEVLVGFTDSQGISYLLNRETKTAMVGDGSDWENNSGYCGKKSGNIVIPASVIADGVTYRVNQVSDNAFCSNCAVRSVVLPNTITTIGDNAFCKNTMIYVYEGGIPHRLLQSSMYQLHLMHPINVDETENEDEKQDSQRESLGDDAYLELDIEEVLMFFQYMLEKLLGRKYTILPIETETHLAIPMREGR